MSGPTYSFVFDRKRALETFKKVGEQEIMLAVLAGLTPEPGWDGCLVYAGGPEPLRTIGAASGGKWKTSGNLPL